MAEQSEDQALEARLKSALWYAIGKIVDEETIRQDINATPQFIGAMTEMVWSQIESVAQDLEAFANHANRRTISTEDVMLLTRRNEGLEEVLKAYLEELRGDDSDAENRRRSVGKKAGRPGRS